MATCWDCRGDGREYKRVLAPAWSMMDLYDRRGRLVQMLDWETVDAGPCKKCSGTGIEPAKADAIS